MLWSSPGSSCMFIASLQGGLGRGVWEWSGRGECGSGVGKGSVGVECGSGVWGWSGEGECGSRVGERDNFCTGDPRFEVTAVYLAN